MSPKKRGADGRGGGRKKQSRAIDLETREGRNMQVEMEATLMSVLPRMVEKAVKKLLPSFCSGASSSCSKLVDPNCSPRYKLAFMNGLDAKIYTRKIICDTNREPLKICILFANGQGGIIDVRILNAKIRVVILPGDFDEHSQEISSSIVRPRDKTGGALLTGPPELSLTNGEAYLRGYTFVDNSKFVRSGKFRLGVMVVDDLGERVQEGVTEPFIVMDRRSEGFEKHDIPSLHDDVWRLSKIAKDGPTHNALKASGILFVKDFLRLYYRDEQALRKILVKAKESLWTTIVEHAKKCDPGTELYSFVVEGNNVMLFFNSVCQIVGAKFGDNYIPFDDFEKHNKKEMVVQWSKVAHKKMIYDKNDYVKDENGKPRPVDQEILQRLGMVEHECTDPMQGHSAEAKDRNVCLSNDQQGASGRHSNQCELERLEPVEVAQDYDPARLQAQPHLHELEQEAERLREEEQHHQDKLENEAEGLHEQQSQQAWLLQEEPQLDELLMWLQEQPPLDELEQEATQLQEQQQAAQLQDQPEQQAARLEEQQHQDDLEHEEVEEQRRLDESEQQHQDELEHQAEQQHLEELVQEAARLRAENARVASCAADIAARYTSVEQENAVLRARATELGDRLQLSVNEVLRVAEEFSGIAMDIQEELPADNPLLRSWQLPTPPPSTDDASTTMEATGAGLLGSTRITRRIDCSYGHLNFFVLKVL